MPHLPDQDDLEPPQPSGPSTAAQLEAQLARERQEQLDAELALTPPPAIGARIATIGESLDELEQLAGPPDEAVTVELMAQIEELAEHAEGDDHDAVMGLAGRLAELAGREAPKTEEEIALEAQEAELNKAQTAYLKKVRNVLGDELPLEPCPACDGRGLVAAGAEEQPQLREHEKYRRCPACDGYGHVLTGSRLEGSDVQACPDCGGRGFLERQQTDEQIAAAVGNGELEVTYGKPSWLGDPNLTPQAA